MKTIPLTQGQVALVDDEDFLRFGHLKWCARWDKKTRSFYAVRSITNKPGSRPKQRDEKMHRAILLVTDPQVQVDHCNHDTLDNRRKNLRSCTHSQNRSNLSGAQRNSKSGIRGVSFNKKINKWRASIKVNRRTKNLGDFENINDAASAYAAANRRHFGEFGGKI